MTRPIGQRIIQACEIVERFGVCGSPDVQPILGVVSTNTIKYLSRAVGYRLLTVDRTCRPHQYRVVPGWREKVKPIQRVQPYVVRPAKAGQATRTAHLQAVWGACA